jgi:tetratricopeptide (TPR) repeat protein
MTMNNTSQPATKLIFKGRLDFGNPRSYELALKQWNLRAENYFRNNVLFKAEDVFSEAENALILPQPFITLLGQSDKAWRGTTDLFREIMQYAVAGRFHSWFISGGNIQEVFLEPGSAKGAAQDFLEGRELAQKEATMSEACEALSNAISKYQKHALAYERRGYVNYKLGNFNDALYDFSKSIDINPNNAEPYYGRGKVRMIKNEWESAVQDFDATLKREVALQPLHWLARLKKGECHVHLKQYPEAIKELQFFLKREFKRENPNFFRRRRAWYMLGKALLGSGDINAALDAFNTALSTREGMELLPEAEALLQRGLARKSAGEASFMEDIQHSAQMGNKEAIRMMEDLAK